MPIGIAAVTGHKLSRSCGVRVHAKTKDLVKRRIMLLDAGFTSSQTDSLLSSFVLSDDSPPSKAEVTLELSSALEPIKQSLSDISNTQDNILSNVSKMHRAHLWCPVADGHCCQACNETLERWYWESLAKYLLASCSASMYISCKIWLRAKKAGALGSSRI